MDSDKTLKREDELTELSKIPNIQSVLDDKTKLQKPNEQGHSLLEKAKETIASVTSKLPLIGKEPILDTPESREEEGKVLKREDELTDLSEMKFDDRSRLKKLTDMGQELVDKAKESFENLKKTKDEREGFIKVKEGISEDADEIRHHEQEEVQKELHSNNPFEALADSSTDTSNVEGKTITEKIKDASNTISEKLTETKEKIKSAFVSTDKENAPQATA